MKFFLSITLAALILHSPARGQGTVACDLVDPATAVAVLGSALTKHTPSKGSQTINGDLTISDCLFFARQGYRDSLHVKLVEYPSVKRAEQDFVLGNADTDFVKNIRQEGIGDEARWWSIGTEAHGLSIRKGRRVLILDTRWRDGNTGAGLKERLKPIASAASRKL
jgi:hypothetical protein